MISCRYTADSVCSACDDQCTGLHGIHCTYSADSVCSACDDQCTGLHHVIHCTSDADSVCNDCDEKCTGLHVIHCTSAADFCFAAPVTVNEEVDDISIRTFIHNEQFSLASSSYSASDDGSSMVVNMRNKLQFHNNVRIRQPGLTDTDVGINLRVGRSTCKVDNDLTDLQFVGELEEHTEKPKGYVLGGGGFTFLPHYFKLKLQIYDGMVHGCNQNQCTQSHDFVAGF